VTFSDQKDFLHGIMDAIFPVRCPLCNRFNPRDSKPCPDCLQSINRIDSISPKILLPHVYLDGVISTFAYEGIIRDAICSFKFNERLDLLGYLSAELALSLSLAGKIDVIVPVPMHATKVRARGFNPASMLARRVARAIHTPMRSDLLERVKHTSAQMDLHRRERMGNVRDVFALNGAIHGVNRILLMDDVLTTGATANECARVLKSSGVGEVIVGTVARTL